MDVADVASHRLVRFQRKLTDEPLSLEEELPAALAGGERTKADLFAWFNKHITQARLNKALAVLLDRRLVAYRLKPGPTGRPAELWRLQESI
jgi:predicted ArsR family transcriptional regulator